MSALAIALRSRKFLGATLATATLLAAFVFVAATGRGIEAYSAFGTSVVAVYIGYAGANAGSKLAAKKVSNEVD